MISTSSTEIHMLEDVLLKGEVIPDFDWELRMLTNEDCLSYVAWNRKTKEALLVDPKREDAEACRDIIQGLADHAFIAVIDTHTHADHVSVAAEFASELKAPLIMHEKSASRRVQIRISKETQIHTSASPLRFFPTPGHTNDSICVLWGPFLFTGDTILFGDVGRDDLPTGDAVQHYESLSRMRELMASDGEELGRQTIILPGHDNKGGRASSWNKQLALNPSLTQAKDDFVREAREFTAAPPKHMDEALRLNTQ